MICNAHTLVEKRDRFLGRRASSSHACWSAMPTLGDHCRPFSTKLGNSQTVCLPQSNMLQVGDRDKRTDSWLQEKQEAL